MTSDEARQVEIGDCVSYELWPLAHNKQTVTEIVDEDGAGPYPPYFRVTGYTDDLYCHRILRRVKR